MSSVIAEPYLLPISALQHFLFCQRQMALIHVERLWAENRLTVEGMHLHRRAHGATDELRGNTRIVRSLSLRSLEHRFVGMADIVEFTPTETSRIPTLRSIPFGGLFRSVCEEPRAWQVTPVEYKRGKPKKDDSDRVQLCAQALCLEEMLGVQINSGELFYGKRRRRTEVTFDENLRGVTLEAAGRCHELISLSRTPPAEYAARCDRCSLISLCLPKISGRQSVRRFLDHQFATALMGEGPDTDPDSEIDIS